MKLPACSSRCTGQRARRSSSTTCGSAWNSGLNGVSWKSPGSGCSAVSCKSSAPGLAALFYRLRQLLERLFEPREPFGHAGHDRLCVRAGPHVFHVPVRAGAAAAAVRLLAHGRVCIAQPAARVALLGDVPGQQVGGHRVEYALGQLAVDLAERVAALLAL